MYPATTCLIFSLKNKVTEYNLNEKYPKQYFRRMKKESTESFLSHRASALILQALPKLKATTFFLACGTLHHIAEHTAPDNTATLSMGEAQHCSTAPGLKAVQLH